MTNQADSPRLLEWLGAQRTPSTSMVIAHLRHCVATSAKLHPGSWASEGRAPRPCVEPRGLRPVRDGAFVEPATVFNGSSTRRIGHMSAREQP